jgi:ABC-type spermidine/putrescine transport system permease subunit II
MVLAILSLFGLNFLGLSTGFAFGEPTGWYVDLTLALPLIVGAIALVLGLLSLRSRSTAGRSFAVTAVAVALVAIPVGGLSWYSQYEQRQAFCESTTTGFGSSDGYASSLTVESDC